MAAFNVLETQFQMFITNRDYLNDEYVAMKRNYFIQYTGQAIPEFRDTLIQHLESVKRSIDERVQLKREYESWVNERQVQTTEEKVDTSQALDASSFDTESSRTESKEQDTSSRSGMHMLMMQISDPYTMKSQWLRYLINQGFKEFSSDVQAMTSDHNSSELGLHDHNNEQSSSKLVPKVVPPVDKTATSRQVLELLFHNHITML
nr:hypothetical protein [Tanacetum cinerariifolium]